MYTDHSSAKEKGVVPKTGWGKRSSQNSEMHRGPGFATVQLKLFTSGGQSFGASTSVLPMNIQD